MKHQQTFWRLWLSPRWISGVSTSPPPPFPPSLPPPTPQPPPPPPPTLLLCQYHPSLGEPQILNISCDGQWSRKHRARQERPRRGKRALSHFLGGAGVVDGKRMHCGLLEEPDMDSTGQSRLNQLNLSCGWEKKKETSAQKNYFVSCCCCCCCSFLNFPCRLSEQVSGCSSVDFFHFKKKSQPIYNQVFRRGTFVRSAVIVVEHCPQFKDKSQKTEELNF